MNNELENLRKQINDIDSQVLDLITQRAEVAKLVLASKLKMAGGEAPQIFFPQREREVIARLIDKNTSALPGQSIASIFQAIMNACRNLQITMLADTKDAPKAKALKISVQGIEHSYSHQAAVEFCNRRKLPNYRIDYAVSSNNVLDHVVSGKTQYGIVALNNAQGGLVDETIKALTRHNYNIVDSVVLPVEHSLLVLPGTKKEQITHVYSHSQALRQCAAYLKKEYPNCKQIEWADTALSASDLAAGKIDKHSAVIAHANCAKTNGLNILDQNIQDLKNNETLFLVVNAGSANG
ncbi:MAG: prephenate dehydratase domain-containing protein [Pseudomonadota bacterium]